MPSTPAPYVRRPYTGDGLIRLADLGLQMARLQSNAVRDQGQQSAQRWSGAGQAISQGLGAIREERQLIPLRQAAAAKLAHEQELMRRDNEQYAEGRTAKGKDEAKSVRLRQLSEQYQGQRIPTEVLVKEFGPDDAAHLDKAFDELYPKPKVQEPFTLNPGDVRYGADNTQVASNPKPTDAPKLHPVTVPGPNGQPVTKMFTEEQLQQGVDTYRAPVQGPAPERPSLWVTKDGAQRYVTPTDAAKLALEGWRSGQGREQGRPVTSSDAGRVTEFDTSLDDLKVLRNTIAGNGSTGTSAAIGAAMPAWATDLFGWGASAKSKNAMIARVKQVIGKALEGGVLRKEDEEKYKDILPTIQDANELVISKLDGLENAIAKRKHRHLDSLTDAGYDTTQFASRAQVNQQRTTAVPDLSDLPKGRGRKFTSGPFAGQTWGKDANGTPYKVGG